MSIHYQAVGWNRQKKIYDFVIAGFCLGYLVLFTGITLVTNPEATFETLLIRSSSTLALLLLHIILSIGPLARLDNRFLPLLYNRRHLGVTMFFVAATHGFFSIIHFHSLSNTPAIVSVFTSNTRFDSLPGFPFQALGFFALIIFFLMAITSHDFWLQQLSPRIWKTLHMLVYLAYFGVLMHVALGVIQYETNPLFVILLALGSLSLITLHMLAAWKEVKKDRIKQGLNRDGFSMVCRLDEIPEDRARIFCLDKERIAVFKTEGKLYAVHNVCKHQNGPLGEGKIIDGCITCPWHGYQYLPRNGKSPAPFREKISTYDVKIQDGHVWLNPRPYPEGTERPGAIISVTDHNMTYEK